MANPHFDRETITEDIGFKGPHFDESIKEKFSFGLPGLAQQSWSPGGEFGQQGEFQGWRGKEESTPYRQNWEYDNMPGGEFTPGPNTLSPYRYPQDDVSILERGPGPWNEFNLWNSYDPSIVEELYKKGVGPMDLGEMESEDESNILDYYFNQPPLGAVDVMGRPTLPPEMYENTRLSNLTQTWQEIFDRTGDEDLANEWLASQQKTANLGNYDLFHLMQNGYSLEEALEILDTQLG